MGAIVALRKRGPRGGGRKVVRYNESDIPAEVRNYFSKLGRKGGKKGVMVRAANMTDHQRRKSARNVVAARWKKARECAAADKFKE